MGWITKWAWAVVLVTTLAACNLTTSSRLTDTPTPEPITSVPSATPTSDIIPTNTLTATATFTATVPQPPTAVLPSCIPRVDWKQYVVLPGDTLFRIAERGNTTVAELTTGNCIDDPSLITAGQILYVPNDVATVTPRPTQTPEPTATLRPDERLEAYAILSGDDGTQGPQVGCGDSLILQSLPIARSEYAAENIETLIAYFGTAPEGTNTPSSSADFYNPLHGYNLSVDSITIIPGQVDVALSGEMILSGVCFDAILEAQLVGNILYLANVNNARITLNGTNLISYFDMSGDAPDDYVYTRDKFNLPLVP